MAIKKLQKWYDSLTKSKRILEQGPIAAYQKVRDPRDRHLLCKAPFNSMYFNVYGQCAPCWLTLTDSDTYPEKSVREIWFGDKFNQLRKAIHEKNLDLKCQTCKKNIQQGNHISVLSRLYDYPYALAEYPAVMEFELSNRCNLECVMCKGDLSSTIRKNRDQLKPLPMRYDQTFVDQLEEFIPHLKEAKFLGGEPFLIEIYYSIWKKIAKLNPSLKITITTNGSVYNKRVESILSRLDCHLILSLDSIKKDTYENIRINGNLERVLYHFEHFRKYTSKRNNYLGISVNPLRKNWQELADFVNFCNDKDASIWFNTVIYPHDEALWTLPADDLQHIYNFLSGKTILPGNGQNKSLCEANKNKFKNLVEVQIKQWLAEAREREKLKQKLVNAGKTDSGKLLLREIQDYINTDAYISDNQKEKGLSILRKKIKWVEISDPGLLKELYLMPVNNSIAYIRNNINLPVPVTKSDL